MISTSVLGVAASSRASTGSSGGSIFPIATTTRHSPGSHVPPALRPPGVVEIGRGPGMRRDPVWGRTLSLYLLLGLGIVVARVGVAVAGRAGGRRRGRSARVGTAAHQPGAGLRIQLTRRHDAFPGLKLTNGLGGTRPHPAVHGTRVEALVAKRLLRTADVNRHLGLFLVGRHRVLDLVLDFLARGLGLVPGAVHLAAGRVALADLVGLLFGLGPRLVGLVLELVGLFLALLLDLLGLL